MISQIDFRPGDIVRVHQKIKGRSGNKMFTVRKVVGDVAIERIFPIDSPVIEKVESKGKIKQKVTHSKLYFLRKQI